MLQKFIFLFSFAFKQFGANCLKVSMQLTNVLKIWLFLLLFIERL